MVETAAFDFFQNFHWQRPWWLLLIPVAIILAWRLAKHYAERNNWKTVINPELLPYLLQGQLSQQQKLPIYGMVFGLIIAALAMAGPSWEKLPQPIHKSESALVILLDLSPSMVAQDLKPSRLVQARLKLMDLLQQRNEGLTALIAYAGEAHVVTPLTDDTDTIISLLPSLSPGVMPLRGSNTEDALDQARTLFKEAGITEGDLLLVTDGVADDAKEYLIDNLPSGFRLSVLGVGTLEGAPIPARNGGFAKDSSGAIVLAKLDIPQLQQLANTGNGVYRTLNPGDLDLSGLIQPPNLLNDQTRELEREFDTWIDRGHLLALLLLPLMALAFRRGWLLCLPLMLINPQPSYAMSWDDLWLTKDQQAQQLMQQQKPEQAAELFQRNDWKGAAAYQAKEYENAANSFSAEDSTVNHYNLGNALAHAGKLQEAIDAYNKALSTDPAFEDAAFNKQLVESLLQQQKQQEKEKKEEQTNQNQQGQKKQEQNKNGGQDAENSDSSQQSSADNSSPSDDSPSNNNASTDDQSQTDQSGENSQAQASQQEQQTGDNSDDQKNSEETAETEQSQQNEQSDQAQKNQDNSDPVGAEQLAQGDAGEAELSDEEQQAMEQWLRKIPDDPSGLMRKKFEYQYRLRRKEYQQGNWQPPANNANDRW